MSTSSFKKRGASLVELLLTVSILAVVFLAMLSILPTAMMSIRQSEHRLAATALIGAATENLRTGDYTQLLMNDGLFDKTTPGALGTMLNGLDYSTNDAVTLSLKVQVAGLTTTYHRDALCEVNLTCRWTEKSGDQSMVRKVRIGNLKH